jgi:AraC family transcriptional regulator
MNAEIKILYSSDFYKVIDFKCKCIGVCKSKSEYSKSFNISFIRKGNFIYNIYRNKFDMFNGFAIVDKPGSEHNVEHNHHRPDECTIIEFSDSFYKTIKDTYRKLNLSFFENNDIQSISIKTNAEIEYIHYNILRQIIGNDPVRIAIDDLVSELLEWFLYRLSNGNDNIIINPKLKKYHLQTIEQAKNYIVNNFVEDISLAEVSDYCHVSPFHFSRIFKKITHYSPYQYLVDTRLKNAELLIRHSDLLLKDICYQSGFSSIEHFNAAFKKKTGHTPTFFRKSK